jgi:hydroxymethylglutaryl-CoA synthase
MDLFPNTTDMEGATVVNACYGGTAALLNAFFWCESDGWNGKFAIVVAADIAVYARGPARPTSGAGAVAILVGRDAPLSFNPRERATHASNVWDFFKPDHTVEYPTVDGALSQVCYYQALEDVYARLAEKLSDATGKTFYVEDADYFVFHAPYNKLVQKSYARLHLVDARRRFAKKLMNGDEPLKEWCEKPVEETYNDRVLESVLKKISAEGFERRLSDSNYASKVVGNTYTASVFLGLASLIDRCADDLVPGKSIVMFSYGSGALASMYRLIRYVTTLGIGWLHALAR